MSQDRSPATYGEAVCAAADHVGIPREQIDRFLGTLQMCGWHLAPVSETEPKLDKKAQIGATVFGVGIKWSTVIDRAQREWDYFHGLLNPKSLPIEFAPSATPRNPWTFELDAAQVEKMEAWRKEQDALVLERQRADGAGDPFIAAVHEGGSPYYGAIGGELSFSFSPNSIGEVAKVKHSGTGAELDLTDYDAW